MDPVPAVSAADPVAPAPAPAPAAAAAPAPATATAPAPATWAGAPSEVEWKKVTGALHVANEEAKKYRLAAEAAEKLKQDAEKARLEAAGDFKGLFDAERKRVEDLTARTAKVDAYEAVIKRRLDAALAVIPEAQRAKFAALPPELALDFAEDFIAAAKVAAPLAAPAQPKAPQTTAGAPAVTTPALDAMSASDRRAHLATLTKAQKRDLLHDRTGIPPSTHGLARDWGK